MKRSKTGRAAWLALGLGVVGLLGLSRLAPGRGEAPTPRKGGVSPLAAVEMTVRGPDQAMVGRRCTIEVFLFNSGATPVKDLEVVARPDAHMEHDSKAREVRVTVDPIAPDDLQIVRLVLTPRKAGGGGVDLVLRARTGEKEELRHVLPVVPEDPSAGPARAEGASALQFKITPLKGCYADRPGIFLVHVLNTDSRAMEGKRDLVVSYTTVGKAQAAAIGANIPVDGVMLQSTKLGGKGMGLAVPVAGNPIRKTQVTLPALGAGEAMTLPVRLTPRRIGELQIAVTAQPPVQGQPTPPVLGSARLQVKFDPAATVENLLPVRERPEVPSRLPRSLAEVPEVALEDGFAKTPAAEEGFEHVAHLIEKIDHVNAAKTDAFVEALTARRPDVGGLPFAMGDSCRLPAERGRQFLNELTTLRAAMGNPANLAGQLPAPAAQPDQTATQARIAALVQVVGPEGGQLGQQMVKYLASVSHADAPRTLARLAIFADDDKVRADALAALTGRGDKDVDNVLVGGLNYPWPPVARRASEAIAKLGRKHLLPQLVEVLDRPDPRAPQAREKDGKTVTVVRELVRVNHLRNCLLCHSPANPAAAAAGALPQGATERASDEAAGLRNRVARTPVAGGLTAPVPIPGQQVPTPSPQGGYGSFAIPDTLVDFGVTYLRQDFSVKLPVANAQPWPESQRFDFLVRTREITEAEARAYRDLLRPAREGELTPYQSAALASLRQLTGKDAEPTAAAWRSLIAQDRTEK